MIIEFPSPRGSTWINPEFVMTITDWVDANESLAPRSHQERHCDVRLISGATQYLPYSAARAVAGIFGAAGDPLPVYEHCCEYHDPDGGTE